MQEELKRCPFCGGEAKIRHVGKAPKKHDLGVQVRCKICSCGTEVLYPFWHFGYEQRKNLVIERWNRRVKEDEQ